VLDTWRRYICGALGFLALSAPVPAQTAQFVFRNQVSTGANPLSMVIGDFTHHRQPDLVLVQRGASAFTLLESIGNGFYVQPFASQTTGKGPRAVATGDFNRDGIPDLAVANFDEATVSVFLGNGNGTFRYLLTLDASSPSFVLVGDFNRDGLLDLAVTHQITNSVSIFLGTGDDTFRPPLDADVGVGPTSMGIADFNGDGIPDLAVTNATSNNLSILLGHGDGTFRPALNFAAGYTPSFLTVGDFDHDGRVDVAVVNGTNTGTVSVLFGAGNGSLTSPITFDVGANPSFIATADFNLDGNLDLIVANTGDNTVSVLMGTGKRVFVPHLDFEVGNAPAWIGIADFDFDGKPDLIVANSLSNTLTMLANVTGIENQPNIGFHSVVNAASFADGAIAPGELVTIFGSNLGPAGLTGYQANSPYAVTSSLAETQVLFNGVPAPLLYVSNSQIGAVAPYALAGQTTAEVVVQHNGVLSGTLTIPVRDSAPGLFTTAASGSGAAAALNEDSSINSDSNPAAQGSIVVLYGTGAGQTNPAGVDGELAGKVLTQPLLPVSVTIDGKAATILYAGAAGGTVAGVIQVNVQLPPEIHSGTVPVVLAVGGAVSQPGVTISVQ
jgi:uncharacterized protein (TIGR03437 family)